MQLNTAGTIHRSVNDLYDCLKTGAGYRAVAAHALNAQSSRSHAVSSGIQGTFTSYISYI